MLKFVPRQINNPLSAYNGNYYAFPVIEETMTLNDLAKHMADHNCGFSEPVCYGVMQAMVRCIKEQCMEGKNVKIENLAIFSIGIVNATGGAPSAAEFKANRHILGVKLRARATGELTAANLNNGITLRRATAIVGGVEMEEMPESPDDNPSGGNDEPITEDPDNSGTGDENGTGGDGSLDENPFG